MRSVLGLSSIWVLCSVFACGSDTSAPAVATGGSHGDASVGGSGGSIGSDGGWPGGTGGTSGTSTSGGTGAGAGTGGTSGTTGTGGVAGAGTGGQAGSGCGAAGPVQCGTGGACQFPQGVPDPDFYAWACTYQDTDPAVDSAVNAVMASLTGCGVGSDCPITGFAGTTTDEICQSWFAAVTQELRNQGFCAGQHIVGATDEIAVSNTCCQGKWYGYHICNYGGPKVVWNPGARRGWWMITPSYCP